MSASFCWRFQLVPSNLPLLFSRRGAFGEQRADSSLADLYNRVLSFFLFAGFAVNEEVVIVLPASLRQSVTRDESGSSGVRGSGQHLLRPATLAS